MSSKFVLLTDGSMAEFSVDKQLSEIDNILSKEGLSRDIKYPTFSDPLKIPKPISNKTSNELSLASSTTSAYSGLPQTEVIKLKTKEAEKTLEAQRALPQAIETAKQTVATVDKLLTHPGFENLVGMGFPGGRFIPGSETAGAYSLYEQVKGKTFLEALQFIKGTGQITEKEGAKAEAALNRMNISTSEKDFRDAAKDFKDSIQSAINRSSKSAGTTPENIITDIDISSIPKDAIRLLKKNPRLAPDFDAKYGQGASAKALRGN